MDIAREDGMGDIGVDPPIDSECLNPCSSDADCPNDNIFCNGEEYCNFTLPDADTGEGCCDVILPCPPDPGPCRAYACIEETRKCVEQPADRDSDGYAAAWYYNDMGEKVPCEGGDDCDDSVYAVHPGAEEVCQDGFDNDCDGVADEDGWTPLAEPARLSDAGAIVLDAGIAVFEDGWVVAWSEESGSGSAIRIGKCNPDGSLPSSHALTGVSGAGEVELIVTGSSDIFVFWTENGRAIRGKKLRHEGEFQEDAAVDIYEETAPSSEVSDLEALAEPGDVSAGVFFRGQQHGNSEIYMIGVDLSAFNEIDHAAARRVTQAIGFSGYPSAAASETCYAVAWEDERDGNKEIYVRTINLATGEMSLERRLTVSPGDSSRPSVTAFDSGFRVVWMDESGGPFNIMAAQLKEDGAPLSFPIVISEPAGSGFYPYASPDPRDVRDGRDLVLMSQDIVVYVMETFEESTLYLTAIGETSTQIQPGMEIHSTSKTIMKPAVSEGLVARGLTWIEWDYDSTSLNFTILECPGP